MFQKRSPPELDIWPDELNPCMSEDSHTKKCLYNVKGKCTMICSQCLWEKEATGMTRDEALATFNEDIFGRDAYG